MIKFVSIKDFTHNGRFGNQIFQYAFAAFIAKKFNLQLKLPPWAGNDIFSGYDSILSSDGCSAKIIENHLIQIKNNVCNFEYKFYKNTLVLDGYFQHSAIYKNDKSFFRKIFSIKEEFEENLNKTMRNFTDKNIIACHLRFGDYGYSIFYRTKITWLYTWLKANITHIPNAVIYIATDDPKRVQTRLKGYEYIFDRDVYCEDIKYSFLIDHWIMRNANYLLMANSSFSFSAALLNDKSTHFYRPYLSKDGFFISNPWEERGLLYEKNALLSAREKYPILHRYMLKIEKLFNIC